MADQTLLMLIQDVRGKTLKLLDGVTDQQAMATAPGLNNSILWHAGHSLIVNEHLGVSPATGRLPTYPEEWFEKFSWKSQPATVTAWPRLADVTEKLREQQKRLLTVVEELTEEQLALPAGEPSRGRSLRSSILHGMHDEANHQGEIWLIKKLAKVGAKET
jgi:hypothetical protein